VLVFKGGGDSGVGKEPPPSKPNYAGSFSRVEVLVLATGTFERRRGHGWMVKGKSAPLRIAFERRRGGARCGTPLSRVPAREVVGVEKEVVHAERRVVVAKKIPSVSRARVVHVERRVW
jgi:hypothetical protein